MRYSKEILFAFTLAISTIIVWFAIDVFFLAFGAVLLALLLHSIGYWTKKIIHLPYVISLIIALIVILGLFAIVLWLYSPTIAEQFQTLVKQLPKAALNLRNALMPYLNEKFFSPEHIKQELSFSSKAIFTQVMTFFSSTVSSIVSFLVFIVVGFYLAIVPKRYLKGLWFILPEQKKERLWMMLTKIANSLRFWLLGKVLSMTVIGLLTWLGLWLLNVSLALILALLIGLLTFIPYVGAIIGSIPAVLIAFAEYPLKAVYVIVLYIGIHIAEGYFITPVIEQKTVSIPPAVTIMAQILTIALFGWVGLTLATPLIVVILSLISSVKERPFLSKSSS